MDTEGSEILPPFPPSPHGVDRLKHLPTVEAAILYWEAVSRHAWDLGDDSLLETANGLKKSYEDARTELSKVEEPVRRKVEKPTLRKVEKPVRRKVEKPALSTVEEPALSKVEEPAPRKAVRRPRKARPPG